jgi:hypothetical protein
MTDLQKISGVGGCEFIAAASAKTGKTYSGIVINTDAVISVLEVNGVNVLTTKAFNGATVSAGMFIPAEAGTSITAITLTSGTAIAYNNQ